MTYQHKSFIIIQNDAIFCTFVKGKTIILHSNLHFVKFVFKYEYKHGIG